MMRALRAYARNDATRLIYEDAPCPEISAEDVLIRIHACGVSPSELSWPTTWIAPDQRDRPLPIIPGHEVSGVVTACGADVAHLEIGDEVYGLIDFQRDGADAEYVAARAIELAPKPSNLDHVQTAAVPLSGLTAWQALFDYARLARGQRLLIHGGAGGVGSFAVQLAHWRGAHVIATASGADTDLVRALGADEVFDYRTEPFEDAVRNVDIVFDTVGGAIWQRSWRVLRPGGVLVSIAVPRPPIESAPPSIRAIWFVVASRADQLLALAELIDAGHLRPVIGEVLPLARGSEAYAKHRTGPGKMVINVVGVDA